MKNIVCIVGTRPECIKMAPVIKSFANSDWAKVYVVSTGQHRELVAQTLSIFELNVDIDLDVMQHGQTLCGLSSRIFEGIETVFETLNPDLVIVQGDTTSVMVAAIASFYLQIPIAHVEAGLRTGDIKSPFPEEFNRIVAGIVSSLHFAPTKRAFDNLLKEGKTRHSVYLTGNTVIDALLEVSARDLHCQYPTSDKNDLVLVTAHRRENFGEPIKNICRAIRELHDERKDLEFVYPVHPNPNVKSVAQSYLGSLERVYLIPPANYEELVTLIKKSRLVLTDSGGIQEEAPALGKPVLVLRNETERPEAIEANVAVLVGSDRIKIKKWVYQLLDDNILYDSMASGASPYGDGKAALRIETICKNFLHLA
ncbi:UDP-N-acetylglucosamine 2-epimerase (non-hydrolyzing) [Roseibium aquae]|uniref:UDP-N-acetylglucosamine 2-epimerase (non-hydrolyzing) n=1 Tax=Roseibium aquae TaxID=1323746 RepID=A0A916TJV9_9HYPH|nr:UDP-N-acetylglucosamine 2-epimerase (non-hydrolyzing) [Roseibium aquae]GGB48541.1 UDP-N-acetylglucosamine 2-epimerase (non-hydrolyzing) [Roseibium aquae]